MQRRPVANGARVHEQRDQREPQQFARVPHGVVWQDVEQVHFDVLLLLLLVLPNLQTCPPHTPPRVQQPTPTCEMSEKKRKLRL